MTGTKKSVTKVAATRPPMTARPRGAFCSPPSPMPKAMGNMPMIMAMAVMMTGRRRVRPAARAASWAFMPAWRWSLAKVIMRMELAVATPMDMMAPMRAGTLMVVLVAQSIQRIPASAPGRAMRMMSGSSQDWKLTTMRR